MRRGERGISYDLVILHPGILHLQVGIREWGISVDLDPAGMWRGGRAVIHVWCIKALD